VPVPEARGQRVDRIGDGRLTPEAARAEEKAIRAAAAAFSEAFNKGDVEAMLAMWSPEGEYVSESGKTYQGKAQLRAALKKAVAATRGQKHTIQIDKIRFLKPDVAHEEGALTIAGPDGEQEKGHYVALWLKIDGKWLLGSVRDIAESHEEGRPVAFTHLRPLSWLVGEWQEKNGDATLNVRWSPGHAFLLMDWHVKRGDEVLHVHQRVGWDAANQRLRAWVYDSTGGYGDAVWQRDGSKWTVLNEGQYPDGKPARSVNTWKFVNKDTVQWSATDREVDEMPLPDADATYVRKAAPKAEGR
jgi:uncharacterized protein (TIGR02246 family)